MSLLSEKKTKAHNPITAEEAMTLKNPTQSCAMSALAFTSILVLVNWAMHHAKFQNIGLCGFRQEEFSLIVSDNRL